MFRIRFSLPDDAASQVEVEGQTPGEALAAQESVLKAHKVTSAPDLAGVNSAAKLSSDVFQLQQPDRDYVAEVRALVEKRRSLTEKNVVLRMFDEMMKGDPS